MSKPKLAAVVATLALALSAGCASRSQVNALQERVGALEQKVDAAQQAAEKAERRAEEAEARADAMFKTSISK
jgi:outer membrane murein-binding lipoprotein Lpp